MHPQDTFSPKAFHQPDWDFYFCEVDEKPAIISVDLNLADGIHQNDVPYMVYVSVKVNRKSKDGLPLPSELSALCKIEDQLIEMLKKRVKVQFCGRVTTNGCRDLIFYVQNPTFALSLIEIGLKNFPQYKFETGWKEDEEWDTYFSFLFPNEIELNTIFNQRLVAQMVENGKVLTEQQSVEHCAFFKNEEDRDCFILHAIDHLFKIEEVNRDDSKLQHRWSVRISRYDFVDIEHINALTSSLLNIAKECNGVYDGWKISKA